MISFDALDIIIIGSFFLLVIIAGFIGAKGKTNNAEDYLLSGRKIGLLLFITTNVSTWYGGILGVGEFTYRYGLLSWFTQGLPYYIFAIIFGLFFAKKIRSASLFTIPDKISQVYGNKVSAISALSIFILVSPAPYLLMAGNLVQLVFDIDIIFALVISIIFSGVYLFKGGLTSDIYADFFQFFIMFLGFAIALFAAVSAFGGAQFLVDKLPPDHLHVTGGEAPGYILVWFLIAMWTFADPGFHQRCYAAKNENVAAKGIIISVFLWALFDFLTTSFGLYARAALPNLSNPVLAFPLLAENILGAGTKGLFYAAMFATILSTLNSFLFLSATTFSRDFISKIKGYEKEENLRKYAGIGLLVSIVISILLAYSIPSVVELWYSIGSVFIPPVIILVISSYYLKFSIDPRIAFIESILAIISAASWFILREIFPQNKILAMIEPMLIGLTVAACAHLYGIYKKRRTELRR